MKMELSGAWDDVGLSYRHSASLNLVHIESEVFTKEQARVEFERFLTTTTLPEAEQDE